MCVNILPACVDVHCVCAVPGLARRGHWTPWNDCEPPCQCWELNPGPVQEQYTAPIYCAISLGPRGSTANDTSYRQTHAQRVFESPFQRYPEAQFDPKFWQSWEGICTYNVWNASLSNKRITMRWINTLENQKYSLWWFMSTIMVQQALNELASLALIGSNKAAAYIQTRGCRLWLCLR